MNFNKNTIIIVFLFAIIGAFTFADSLSTVSADNSTWIAFNSSNVGITYLTATITATLKNTGSVPAYFKISQVFTDPNNASGDIDWTIINDPGAEPMIDNVNPGNSPDTNQDVGWQIAPGETKTVTFTLKASGSFDIQNPTAWGNLGAVPNTQWPLIPDMGLYTATFMPDEIQTLNPNLQLKSWCGTFNFVATNFADNPVSGIIRGPIIPEDSKLIASSPTAFQDTSILSDTGVASWNVTLGTDDSEFFNYTYEWPIPNNGSVFGKGSSVFAAAGNSNNNTTSTTVPNQNTGIPLGLFGLAAAMVGAGVAYSKFLR